MLCDSLFQSEMFELPEGICLYFKSNFQTCLTYLILEINVISAGLIQDLVLFPVFWRNHFWIVFFITLFSRLKMKLFLCQVCIEEYLNVKMASRCNEQTCRIKCQVWFVGISLGLLSNFADSAGSTWFYAGSVKILAFEKGHCNQSYTFCPYIKIKLKFLE